MANTKRNPCLSIEIIFSKYLLLHQWHICFPALLHTLCNLPAYPSIPCVVDVGIKHQTEVIWRNTVPVLTARSLCLTHKLAHCSTWKKCRSSQCTCYSLSMWGPPHTPHTVPLSHHISLQGPSCTLHCRVPGNHAGRHQAGHTAGTARTSGVCNQPGGGRQRGRGERRWSSWSACCLIRYVSWIWERRWLVTY